MSWNSVHSSTKQKLDIVMNAILSKLKLSSTCYGQTKYFILKTLIQRYSGFQCFSCHPDALLYNSISIIYCGIYLVGAESDQQVNIYSFAVRCDRRWPSTQWHRVYTGSGNVLYVQFESVGSPGARSLLWGYKRKGERWGYKRFDQAPVGRAKSDGSPAMS